ncbi:MAG: SDR family oxidoreductase, partial [Alphaproteobacteria bacterium]
MDRMSNKVVLVVGGAKGIGLAIAERLSAEGANVFVTSRRGEEADKAAEGIGHGAVGITADASSPEDMVAVVEQVRKAYGRIDALVLNAGISEPSQITEITPEHFDRHFDVNVRGMVFGLQAA